MHYDAWNRLVKATDGDSIDISYSYDGLGRMITRTDNKVPAGKTATTDYYYSGQQMLESSQRAPASPRMVEVFDRAVRVVPTVRQRADRERHGNLHLHHGGRRVVDALPRCGTTT